MKRVVKSTIAVILIAILVFYGSFCSLAYYPLISVKSSDWEIQSDLTYSAVYPNHIDYQYAPNSKVYDHEEYNGYTYYGSRFWDDEYPLITEMEVSFPEFDNLLSHNFFIVRAGDVFYLICLGYSLRKPDTIWQIDVKMNMNYIGILEYSPSGASIQGGEVYSLSYPYTTWVHYKYFSGTTVGSMYSVELGAPIIDIIWSDTSNVFYDDSSGNSQRYEKDTVKMSEKTYKIELEKELSVLTGSLSFELTPAELKKLTTGAYCFRVNDAGFIIGTDTSLIVYTFNTFLEYDGNLLGSIDLVSETIYYSPEGDSNVLKPGYASVPYDYVEFADLNLNDVDFDKVSLTVIFVFVSDGYNLFFPGDFEIIEFEHYEDDMQHDELKSAIQDAADIIKNSINSSSNSINSTINSSTSALTNEIVQASTDITNSINQNFEMLISGDTGVPDVVIDTADLDNTVQSQDVMLQDIYNTLDAKNQELLNNLGYSSMDDFFQDNINDLNDSNMLVAFDFVKMLFENVVSVTGISTLVLFTLTFGFAMYVLGRRLT